MNSRPVAHRKSTKRWSDRVRALAVVLAVAALMVTGAAAQERGPTPISQAELEAAIAKLGDLDYPTRMKAG